MEPTEDAHSHIPQISHETSAAEWASHFHHQHSWHQFYPSPMFLSQNNPSLGFNLNQEDDEEVDNQPAAAGNSGNANYQDMEKEPMFEKPLTPSDVGKLNRLVIPKQYAEKYFPLGGDSGDKGLLLSFEDESGKCWRFRYSYWNSSQSYVLTKGWSRYVKEKQLDAGDIILFERHRTDGDRLFIGWRRRSSAAANQDGGAAVSGGGGNDGWNRGLYQGHTYLGHIQGQGTNVPYQPDSSHAETSIQSQTTPGNSKRRLRLFGVNMECEPDESEPLHTRWLVYVETGASLSAVLLSLSSLFGYHFPSGHESDEKSSKIRYGGM